MCTHGSIGASQLPYFFAGFEATRSTNVMYNFLQKSLPKEYQQMLGSFVNMSSKSKVMNFVGSISQDWESQSLKSSLTRSLQSNSIDDDITLVIGGDTFQASPSMPLKAVFNEYSAKKLVSLKSLRFTYEGKTLFLSTAGKKTPDELGMLDNDVIEVHSNLEATLLNNKNEVTKNVKKEARHKQKKKKTGTKSKKGSSKIKISKSDEEHKQDHSRILSQIFEEADPKFKLIRQQLNAMSLFKQQRKTKAQRVKPKQVHADFVFNPSSEGLGSKAGRSRFVVNVGEIGNLYKSSKSFDHVSAQTSSVIDLHGCTQEEALFKLNSGLEDWNEKAMLGSYPFIHSVTIICGAGGQVLSELVEKWIKDKPNVSNAPKIKYSINKQTYASAA